VSEIGLTPKVHNAIPRPDSPSRGDEKTARSAPVARNCGVRTSKFRKIRQCDWSSDARTGQHDAPATTALPKKITNRGKKKPKA